MNGIGDVTCDGFLDRRLTICQPRRGFRAGHDSVLLAASVPTNEGDRVLELGSGAGVVSLCLAARVLACRITGIEIDAGLVELANENAKRNGLSGRVEFISGDVLEHNFGDCRYNHVFLNPPFHPETGRSSPVQARARAMHDDGRLLDRWIVRALGLVRPEGSVTLILRADRLQPLRDSISCGVTVLPLAPRDGEAPKRVIARLKPDAPASLRLLSPMVLHREDGKPTEAAEAVLRHCAPLSFA